MVLHQGYTSLLKDFVSNVEGEASQHDKEESFSYAIALGKNSKIP